MKIGIEQSPVEPPMHSNIENLVNAIEHISPMTETNRALEEPKKVTLTD